MAKGKWQPYLFRVSALQVGREGGGEGGREEGKEKGKEGMGFRALCMV
jgi:hypothetical protein